MLISLSNLSNTHEIVQTHHVDSERVLTVQHRQEVGPCGVLCLFGVIKEDVYTLMVLLKNRSFFKIKNLSNQAFIKTGPELQISVCQMKKA